MAAQAVAVCKAVGTRIPLDFQLGRALLGPVDEEIAALGAPFRCIGCGVALGDEAIQQVRDALVYSHVKVEKRCKACQDA